METKLDTPISFYDDCRDTAGRVRSLRQTLAYIRDDQRLVKMVAALRPLYQAAEASGSDDDKARYDNAKKVLPAVTLSGQFTTRAIVGLATYSNVLQADLDHLRAKGFDVVELKARLAGDPHALFVFESPSGDGLKAGILIETGAEDHAAAFAAMRRYFAATYGIEPDAACSDVSRLCFLSSDPLLHINEAAAPLDWRAWPAPPAPEPAEPDEAADDAPIELPLDALPPIIQALANNYAEVFSVDRALPAISALQFLSAALGGAVECIGGSNGRITPANLYTAISAPPSYGKGSAHVVGKPFIDASAELAKRFEERDRGQLRADIRIAKGRYDKLIEELAEPTCTTARQEKIREESGKLESQMERWKFEAEQLPVYYVGSFTGAALGVALKRNGETLLSFCLESGDAIRIAAGKYSDDKGDYDLLLSAFSGEPYAEARVSRQPVRLSAPCLSVLWLCQPALLRELYSTREAADRGVLARINIVVLDDDQAPIDDGQPREVDTRAEAAWERLILDALDLRRNEGKIVFHATAEAKEVFRAWHNQAVELRNGEERESEAKLMRSRENAIRLATVLAAADWLTNGDTDNTPPLTAEHAARGVALADFFLAQTLALTKGAAFERRQARLEELLKFVDQAGGQITLRLLRKSHGFGEVELRQIVARNSDRLRVETRPTTEKGGRPSPCLIAIGNEKAAGEARPKLPKLPKPTLRRRLRRVSGVSGVSAAASNGNSAK